MRAGERKLRVGVLGATGMVGQRFVALLESHPWFELALVAASPASAGRPYAEAVRDRWALASPVPAADRERVLVDAADVERVASEVDFVFCAVDLPKADTAALEERYARAEVPVVSNNSAHRSTPDVPMLVPEVNPEHVAVIEPQRCRLRTRRGFVAVKPNCSLQSYVPALHPLRRWGLERVVVSTYQAVSGAGKTLASWPDMVDNVIPFISGEEEKSELEPRKLWGSVEGGIIVSAASPVISAQCVRVPVSDGHLATVWASFERAPAHADILAAWAGFRTRPEELALPSAPSPFLTYFDEPSRPQTRLDRELGGGMGVALGRLRADSHHDVRFVALSHNTVRGAAGGAVLMAELLVAEGYLARA